MLANYSVKLRTYVTIDLNFDLNSEVSNKKVIASIDRVRFVS